MERQMFRLGTLGFASLLAMTATTLAQTPVERGQYLVLDIGMWRLPYTEDCEWAANSREGIVGWAR